MESESQRVKISSGMDEVRSSKSDSRCLTDTKDEDEVRATTTLTSYKDRKNKIPRISSRLNRKRMDLGCSKLAACKEMRKELDSLKEQYATVCEQESALRSQIALLTAELVLTETDKYHRRPANVHKILVEPIYIRKIAKMKSQTNFERPEFILKQISKSSHKKYRFSQNKLPTIDSSLNQDQKPPEKKTLEPQPDKCIAEKENQKPESQSCHSNKIHIKQQCILNIPEIRNIHCPYCSNFRKPMPIVYPGIVVTPSTATLTEFRLPKINVSQTKYKMKNKL